MLQLFRGEETGSYCIDSTKLSICHTKRTNSNKVFSGILLLPEELVVLDINYP